MHIITQSPHLYGGVQATLLSRISIDRPFSEISKVGLWFAANEKRFAWTPIIPPEAAGHELQVQLVSPEQMNVEVGAWLDDTNRPGPLDSIDDNGTELGREPPPAPWVSGRFGLFSGMPRYVPLQVSHGATLVFYRHPTLPGG